MGWHSRVSRARTNETRSDPPMGEQSSTARRLLERSAWALVSGSLLVVSCAPSAATPPVQSAPVVTVVTVPDPVAPPPPPILMDPTEQPPIPAAAPLSVRVFPWPPPQPSGRLFLPATDDALARLAELEAPTLADADALIRSWLRPGGYEELGYYSLEGGFAVVTKWENIESSGRPKSAGRWIQVEPTPSVWNPWNILVWMVHREVPIGRSRVFALAVTDRPTQPTDSRVTAHEVMDWNLQGLDRLPSEVGRASFTPEHGITILVYEFEKTTATHADQSVGRFISPSQLETREHLELAGVGL